jgi:hypothetical protein
MIVIYHDVGGAHSSAIAANIHINSLPYDKVPDKSEILNLPTFDKIEKRDHGHLLYMGVDEFGCSVYTLSRQYQEKLVIHAITDMYKALNRDTNYLYIVSTSPTVNTWMKIGGFSSRRLHWVKFGRPIVTYGTLKAYPQIVELVKDVKNKIGEDLKRQFK